MSESKAPRVAIVDYGMGNLFSVKHACEHVGLAAEITFSGQTVLDADAVILPGVGAFGDAMDNLRKLDLVDILREVAASSKPLVGICLGMQLLMSESCEFGHHAGLGIIPGSVVRFESPQAGQRMLKVPAVCWNQMFRVESSGQDPWAGSLLDGLPDRVFMYFVHSYYCKLEDQSLVLSRTRYGNVKFCSSLNLNDIFAFQCHPERSGPQGLKVYANLAKMLGERLKRN
jgi:glutamine amidotransferase